MSLSEIAIRTEMSQAGGTIRAEETHKIQQWADSAELLGAPHVRVFAGNLPGGASEKPGIEWVIEAMKPACDYAARRGITLGIENHGGMTARASTTVEILRRVRPARTSAIFLGQQSGRSTWTVLGGFLLKADTRDTCPRNMKLKKIR
jgi:hypothetical protein